MENIDLGCAIYIGNNYVVIGNFNDRFSVIK
jgi:hypothetical protein